MAQDLKEIIKREYMKCALDPEYFLRKYSYIQVPNKGRQLFDLYDYQADALQDFQDHRFNILLKGRQIGMSTLIAGYALWRMLFKSDENILVIAIKQDVAKNLVSKVRFMHQLLPTWLKGNLTEDNKLTLKFGNGSAIKATATREDAGRSEALSLLIIDEAAFVDGAEDIWTAAQATLSTTGGSAVLISTPNGMGNFFHKTWVESESGENDFNRILLDWRVHPNRDESWKEEQMKTMSEMQFAQEHGASFIFSGNTVISPEIIEFYRQTYMQDPMRKEGFDGNFWMWEDPDYTKSYMVCADVARGDGSDYSAAHVIDLENAVQVAEYRGKIGTKDFGNLLVEIATKYNDALLIPENSNIGWATIQQIIDRGYNNLFYMSKDLKYVDTSRQVTGKLRSERKRMVAGFTTSQRTRPLIIAKLQAYAMDNSITVRSKRTIAEWETFIWHNGKPEALEGYHDDLTMALAIGLWVRDTALRLRQEGIELNRQLLGNITNDYQKAFFTGKEDKREKSWKIAMGDGEESLEWLL